MATIVNGGNVITPFLIGNLRIYDLLCDVPAELKWVGFSNLCPEDSAVIGAR